MKQVPLALALALAAIPAARAATTTASVPLNGAGVTPDGNGFVDLGAGPMRLGASGGSVVYQIGDASSGTAKTFVVQVGDPPVNLCDVTAHVFAKALDTRAITAVVATGTGVCVGSSGSTAIPNGADVAEGNTGDTAWSGSGAATVIATLKAIYGIASGSIPAGTSVIGKVGVDQTTDGATNLVVTKSASGDACNSATAHLQAAFSITSATQTSLVAAVASQKVYICSIVSIAGAAESVAFYDVGSAGLCSAAATDGVFNGTPSGTPPVATNGLSLAANGGFSTGNGAGTIAFTPTANSTLCVVTSGTGPYSGVLTYVQK